MEKEVSIWYDEEGDFLEIIFEKKLGYFKETETDSIMEKIDNDGNLIGFSIMKISALKGEKPLSINLKTKVA